MSDYSQFWSVTFIILRSPEESVKTERTIIHIPGGNVNVMDISGKLEQHLPRVLFFDEESQYVSLKDYVGTTSDLALADGTTLTDVYLDSLVRVQPFADGQTLAAAEFIQL